MSIDCPVPTLLRTEMRLGRISSLTVLALVSASGPAFVPVANADEGGVPFWLSGQFASLSAVPANPGWSIVALPYFYNGSADASFSKGNAIVSGDVSSQMPLLLVQPGYAAEEKIFGGQPYGGLGIGIARNDTDADASISFRDLSTQLNRSDATTGGTDLYPYASLSWNRGVNNWMAYVQGDVPIGAYDSQRLANIGIGHAAIDVGGGYTYLNDKTGLEFSGVLGVTYNWENTETNYQNGVDAHLDWAVSQFLSEHWHVGVVGYGYQQLSADSYPTDGAAGALRSSVLGDFKSRVYAVGPEVGYLFEIGGQPAYINVRGYNEFEAQNRIEGYSLFATLVIPLGPEKNSSGGVPSFNQTIPVTSGDKQK